MSEKQEKRKRTDLRLQYLHRLEMWLAEEPAWWRFVARKRWRACRPQKPGAGRWSGLYDGR